jgi:hypothetical protein
MRSSAAATPIDSPGRATACALRCIVLAAVNWALDIAAIRRSRLSNVTCAGGSGLAALPASSWRRALYLQHRSARGHLLDKSIRGAVGKIRRMPGAQSAQLGMPNRLRERS